MQLNAFSLGVLTTCLALEPINKRYVIENIAGNLGTHFRSDLHIQQLRGIRMCVIFACAVLYATRWAEKLK
jgi:hypothetical protein